MIASKVSFHQLNNNGLHRNYLKLCTIFQINDFKVSTCKEEREVQVKKKTKNKNILK